jgi:hypothetical protein
MERVRPGYGTITGFLLLTLLVAVAALGIGVAAFLRLPQREGERALVLFDDERQLVVGPNVWTDIKFRGALRLGGEADDADWTHTRHHPTTERCRRGGVFTVYLSVEVGITTTTTTSAPTALPAPSTEGPTSAPTPVLSPEPPPLPTPAPTSEGTAPPSPEPAPMPTGVPTHNPTVSPTPGPTSTDPPIMVVTPEPTPSPTAEVSPTDEPTPPPTPEVPPTAEPTFEGFTGASLITARSTNTTLYYIRAVRKHRGHHLFVEVPGSLTFATHEVFLSKTFAIHAMPGDRLMFQFLSPCAYLAASSTTVVIT